jgi:hypothetical protein
MAITLNGCLLYFNRIVSFNLIIDVGRKRRIGNVSSHALHNFELSLVDDDSAVGEDEFGDAVDGHALEDVEVDSVVVGFGGDGPELERFVLGKYF